MKPSKTPRVSKERQDITGLPTSISRFDSLIRKIVGVPKAEVDAAIAREKKRRKKPN